MRGIRTVATLAVVAALGLTACGSGDARNDSNANSTTSTGVKAAKATSAADFGGLAGLEAAAKAEGKLNVIALPHNWANYGLVIEAFKKKYPEIEVVEQNPDASSAEEIAAAQANKGTDTAPDVFDLGTNVALSSTQHFAPYKNQQWDKIPAGQKESSGLWVSDYTGVMVVGYNKTKYGEITSLDQLTDSKFAGAVALNGNPVGSGAAFSGFIMTNFAEGGTLDNLQPGLDYFKKLKESGSLNVTDVTDGTIDSGEHGVVFDWSYNHVSHTKRLSAQNVEWATFLPKNIAVGSYYKQAINVDAPHPAAARLWQEFLYSLEAQDLWAQGGAVPVLAEHYSSQFSAEAKAAVPAITDLKTPTTEQADAVTKFLEQNWDAAIS